MLENNNLKVCRKLVWHEFQFHKGRSMLLAVAITLVCMLCTFSFALGFMVRDGHVYDYQVRYGSTSHILYYGLNRAQAEAIACHGDVKKTVSLGAVGVLSDDVMEYRNVKLAAVSSGWAAATEAVPVCGRMPEAEDEIALDELTLQSLAVPRKEGAKVTVRWMPVDGGKERTDTFRLCGWWGSDMGVTETCAWITQEAADKLCAPGTGSVTLGVNLYRPDDLEKQGAELLHKLGMDGVSYSTNLAYNKVRLARADSKAVPFYLINIVVAVCGILMVYNIVRISTGQNVRFYGRLKSLGMTHRQIRVLLIRQVAYLCLPAVPAGWALGFMLHMAVAPQVLSNMGGQNPALQFFSLRPFVCSAFLTCLTTLAACMLQARYVSGISPAQAVRFTKTAPVRPQGGTFGNPGKRRRTTVPLMALSGFMRGRGRFALSVCSLLFALTMLCFLWTMYVSADEEKYLEAVVHSDYLVADASAATGFQRYNPWSKSITPELMEALRSCHAVTDLGVICTMEVPMYAGEEERAVIVENFESVDQDGVVRKESMAGLPDWGVAYEKFRKTGEYIGIAMGIDGLALSRILEKGEYVEGTYDAAQFATGKYVVASGASTTSFLSTPAAGSRVELGGRMFEVMASVSYQSGMISGSDSREAAFNISYYMPVEVYEELFPGSGIRNVLVDIDYNSQKEFEEFLSEIIQDTGIQVTMRSQHQWNFHNALFHKYVIPMYVGTALLFIGILNFVNVLVTGMLVRSKEFAVYESLGMARRQIRDLLVWEGLMHGGTLILILVPAVSSLTWIAGRWWFIRSPSSWCATWQYSLMPLWISLPLLVAAEFAALFCSLRAIAGKSVTQRLRVVA